MSTGGRLLWWSPKSWSHRQRTNQRLHHLAHTFHNAALYASQDMRGFNEECFWNDIEHYTQQYPEVTEWTNYKELFEQRLADPTKTW